MVRESSQTRNGSGLIALGACLCGAVRFEIDVPACWSWHDHSAASRKAHGAAYATYVGAWKSRFRMIEGDGFIGRYTEPETRAVRSFCTRCGTPVFYDRPRAPKMVNIPRALFDNRVGREPRYHIAVDQMREWAFLGEKLGPLKGFPGVVWERPRRQKQIGFASSSDGAL